MKTIEELENQLRILHQELAATEHVEKTAEIRHKRKFLKNNISLIISKIIRASKRR